METTNFYNLIILDESGSMETIRNTAVSGCNETLQTIRGIQNKYEGKQNHFVSLVSFNSINSMNMIMDKVPANEAECISIRHYSPDGCTPLYDAMGLSCKHLQSTMDRSQKSCVLVTVITDGYENDSRIFDSAKLKSMIDELKTCGWTFAYIGANQDVFAESRRLNIDQCLSFKADDKGSNEMFERLSSACHSMADSWECYRCVPDDIFDETKKRNK